MYLILPLALIVVLIAVIGFVWAARRGQFDDLDTPAMRVLHDDAGRQPANGSGVTRDPAPRRGDSPGGVGT
jgi:cbb3-type cytochrome oxidase maturation protein